MVKSTDIAHGMMRTFGRLNKYKNYNHRVPLKYQRFQSEVNPDEILEYYSKEHIPDRRDGARTYGDARKSMGRKNYILAGLSDQDLEMNHLYQKELDRQRAIVARVNKIKVIIDSMPGKGMELFMNKDISTPYDCARHVHDLLLSRTVVAEVTPLDTTTISNEKQIEAEDPEDTEHDKLKQEAAKVDKPRSTYWDMHRPLEESCSIKMRHFSEKDVSAVNKIYWRSCSFVLGMAIRQAFKDGVKVLLHSWPRPDIRSGSFIYDVALNLSETWQPDERELRAFTKIMWSIKDASLPFDRLLVNRDVARSLFSYNPIKLSQIDSILEKDPSQGKITVYRCGGLLDISVGPMIANTSQIGRISLASVHPYETNSEVHKSVFYRFQGVSLPQQLPVSSYLYQNVILDHAKKLNKAAL